MPGGRLRQLLGRVDGVPFTRTCLTAARPGLRVGRHPAVGGPPLYVDAPVNPVASPPHHTATTLRRERCRRGGDRRRTTRALQPPTQREPMVARCSCSTGERPRRRRRVPGALVVIARLTQRRRCCMCTPTTWCIATGASELHPVCDGNMLRGIVHRSTQPIICARHAGVDLGAVATVDLDDLVRIEGVDGASRASCCRRRVGRMRLAGRHQRIACAARPARPHGDRSARAPRRPRSRNVRAPAAAPIDWHRVPVLEGHRRRPADGVGQGLPTPRAGEAGRRCVAPARVRAAVCMPHLRAFVTDQLGRSRHQPFTGRPASRQLTIAEAAADVHLDPFRRTALHDEHLRLGARMDRFGGWWRPWNYGDHLRRVLGRARRRVARRRVDARQDDRDRSRRGRGARAPLPHHDRTTSGPAAAATCCCSTSAVT